MPERVDVCGLLLALSLTANVPVAVPVAVGENVTLMVQLLPLFNVVPQVEAETANGADVEYEIPVSVVDRLFSRVNFLTALVLPTFVVEKVQLLGVSVACATPVPDSATVWGLVEALSVNVNVPA